MTAMFVSMSAFFGGILYSKTFCVRNEFNITFYVLIHLSISEIFGFVHLIRNKYSSVCSYFAFFLKSLKMMCIFS